MTEPALTPMMQQYRQIKEQIPADALLLFRLGDFYELFFEDAQVGSALLDLTLTHRQGMPMCGMPYAAAESYISRLISQGKRVAICDQAEVARPGQLVKREITRIVSPGSIMDAGLLPAKQNNFCAAVLPGRSRFGVALLDLSTGEFQAGEVRDLEGLQEWLAQAQPSEVIFPRNSPLPLSDRPFLSIPYDDWTFALETADFTLRDHFKTQSLDGFGITPWPLAIGAAGGLAHYLHQELRRDLQHVRRLTTLQNDRHLIIDAVTLRNLEIVESARGSAANTTLLAAIDRTVTAGGGRMLRQWLLHPLRDPSALQDRQEAVAYWHGQESLRESLRQQLQGIRDLERLIARLSQGSGNARDLVGLQESLRRLPPLLAGLPPPPATLLRELLAGIEPLPDLAARLEMALTEHPPLTLKDGGMIRPGYRAELDELVQASTEGKEWLAQLQQKEQDRTGIKSLKIRYNQVFGYYIEITRSNLGAVPDDYIRKQTLANAERFITPDLKQMESRILGAEERSRQLEYEIFLELRQSALEHLTSLQGTAQALHTLDVLAAWGALAQERQYCRPELVSETVLEIKDGRHPVLEQLPIGEKFVPNDARLSTAEERLILLTGPNMAGKSTYIRQIALLAILAHTGCFLPAAKARIGLLDRVFSRVGASDDLSRGQSTFMVEMNETANILHHATPSSLVILDEIGRGTSTFDGLSIAWAVAEFLHQESRALTLFATHYHELMEMAQHTPTIRNYSVAVREWNDQVIFLRKIIPGGADKSYGIQVARLAGLPPTVLARAQEILRNLEDDEFDGQGQPKLSRRRTRSGKLRESGTRMAEFDLFATPDCQAQPPTGPQ